MITRGHFIGEIVDAFTGISERVETRNRLGITDMSVFTEAFVGELLNAVLGTDLHSLNDERPNEPGLDLGDTGGRYGIQVTATASSQKVRHTLDALTAEQAKAYERIVVFCLGKKQTSYSVEGPFKHGVTFDPEKDIWDFTEIARMVLALPLDKLQAVHQVVRRNTVQLLVELEVPDGKGRYPTNGYDKWEARPPLKCGDGKAFLKFYEKKFDELEDETKVEIEKALPTLAKKLRRLPRVTREFLAMLIERREHREPRRNSRDAAIHAELNKVLRECGGKVKEELDLLIYEGLVDVDGEDPHESGAPEIFMDLTDCIPLREGLVDFIKSRGLTVRQVIGGADLSAF